MKALVSSVFFPNREEEDFDDDEDGKKVIVTSNFTISDCLLVQM